MCQVISCPIIRHHDLTIAPIGERKEQYVLSIVVTVKQVHDPEAPASTFKIDPETERVVLAPGIPPVLNPYDENALEAALRIKDANHCRVTVISLGAKLAKAVHRKCLAAGADDLFLLEDELFRDLDSYCTAFVLAIAIRRIGQWDLILTGRLAADTTAGVVGSGIAEMMQIPSVTVAGRIEIAGDGMRVERVVADGCELVEVPLPALVTVSHELGELRNVSLQELMAAQDKPITTWRCQDLGIESLPMRRVSPLKLFIPHKETSCEIVEGASEAKAGTKLALKLRDAKLI